MGQLWICRILFVFEPRDYRTTIFGTDKLTIVAPPLLLSLPLVPPTGIILTALLSVCLEFA
jgi:hypothetical protein